jgi:hypothetical protein
MEVKYKIVIIKSGIGNFTWHLMSKGYNNSFRKISEAPQMFTSKSGMRKTIEQLSRALQCPVEYFDLSQDYEE